MIYETITAEPNAQGNDAVTLITLDRPKALNALNSKILEELIDAFAAYQTDDSQLCAVLTGSGDKAFAAGADIKEMSEKPAADFYLDDFFAPWTSEIVKKTRKPWIAAVNGFALGGGCELAMMADFIIASDRAKFGQPEITLGVAPGMGGSQRLTRAIGKSKAMEMCLTGRMMDAEEAERANLVVRVVPHDELLESAMKTAAKISSMPPMAAIANKEMVNAAFESTLDQGLIMGAPHLPDPHRERGQGRGYGGVRREAGRGNGRGGDMRKGEALRILKRELEAEDWDNTSAFTVRDVACEDGAELGWWSENTPQNESSNTPRNRAYLRAYLQISGRDRLQARGIRLHKGRLWMDRSVISRLERDKYLVFLKNPDGEFEPVFELTEKGRKLIA